VQKSRGRRFEEEMKTHFNKPLLPGMKPKFDLLHRGFPGLKITTNFDCLIENNAFGAHVNVCRGDQGEELEKWFTYMEKNALLKIHGDLQDVSSIVLSSSQYAEIYRDPAGLLKVNVEEPPIGDTGQCREMERVEIHAHRRNRFGLPGHHAQPGNARPDSPAISRDGSP
jgi:hypothetical protein